MKAYRKLNLQYFGKEEPDFVEGGEFDLEKFQQEFEANYQEEDEHEDDQSTDEEIEESDEEEDESTESGQPSEEESDEEEEESSDSEESEESQQDQVSKQNEAFARMRRELEEKGPLAEFVNKLAKQQGVSPEQLMEAYEERQRQAQAQEMGVSLEVYDRLQALEHENAETKREAFVKDYNNQVRNVQKQYDLSETDISNTFAYLQQQGYIKQDDTIDIPFEDAYILANKANLLDNAKEKGRQEYLENKKKKQKTAPINTGGGTSTQKTEDFSEDDVLAYFKKHDIPID